MPMFISITSVRVDIRILLIWIDPISTTTCIVVSTCTRDIVIIAVIIVFRFDINSHYIVISLPIMISIFTLAFPQSGSMLSCIVVTSTIQSSETEALGLIRYLVVSVPAPDSPSRILVLFLPLCS